jgi:hypothetical protein
MLGQFLSTHLTQKPALRMSQSIFVDLWQNPDTVADFTGHIVPSAEVVLFEVWIVSKILSREPVSVYCRVHMTTVPMASAANFKSDRQISGDDVTASCFVSECLCLHISRLLRGWLLQIGSAKIIPVIT